MLALTALLSIIGLICGIVGSFTRNVEKASSHIGTTTNALVLAMTIVTVILVI